MTCPPSAARRASTAKTGNDASQAENPLLQRLVPVLFEDEALLAVDKPAGIAVGGASDPPTADPAAHGRFAGLADILAAVRGRSEVLIPVNRFAVYESGVLLLAKRRETAEAVRRQLKSMGVSQEFAAVASGPIRDLQMTIGVEQGASRGRRRPERTRREGRAMPAPKRAGRSAPSTAVRVTKRSGKLTLLRCRTRAPNTHALRAQLRSVGLRLLGERLAGRSGRPVSVTQTRLHLVRVKLHHPETRRDISIQAPLPGAFFPVERHGDVHRALRAALIRRLPLLCQGETDACRLLTGRSEAVPGIVAEKYADFAMLRIFEDGAFGRDALRNVATWYGRTLDLQAVYATRFPRHGRAAAGDGGTGNGPRRVLRNDPGATELLYGEGMPEQTQMTEYGLKFAVRPHDGLSVGLFLDHRENRQRVKTMSGGRRVLNLFAYTCGFSVAAAAGGARRTVSVDIAPRHLEWGRANFTLNGIDPADHEFVVSDAAEYLRRAAKQGGLFDLIVLDPPTFAHGRKRGRRFSIERDLAGLIAGALSTLSPDGVIMVSTSYRKASAAWLRQQLRRAAGGRRVDIFNTPGLPPDFAVDPDHAKTLFARHRARAR